MNKSVEKKLREINARVPQELSDAVITKQYVAPDLREEIVAYLAMELTEEEEQLEQQKVRNIFDAGHYDAQEYVVNEDIAKQIEEWVAKEIDAAVKRGELPDPKSDQELKKYVKKVRKYEKRKRDALKRGSEAVQGESTS